MREDQLVQHFWHQFRSEVYRNTSLSFDEFEEQMRHAKAIFFVAWGSCIRFYRELAERDSIPEDQAALMMQDQLDEINRFLLSDIEYCETQMKEQKNEH